MAYWPNVIARVGLRFPLYPLFLAPALYYLVRGLRRQQRNDFIWSGIALGIDLRLQPLPDGSRGLCGAGAAVFAAPPGRRPARPALLGLAISALVALVLFLPLVRYSLKISAEYEPGGLSGVKPPGHHEQAYPAPPLEIFSNNLREAWVMPFWDDGEVWVNSIPGRPGLDVVTAVLYFMGTVLVALRLWRKRHWIDLFLLAAVPLLMMPSIMALAFPMETLRSTGRVER